MEKKNIKKKGVKLSRLISFDFQKKIIKKLSKKKKKKKKQIKDNFFTLILI